MANYWPMQKCCIESWGGCAFALEKASVAQLGKRKANKTDQKTQMCNRIRLLSWPEKLTPIQYCIVHGPGRKAKDCEQFTG